MYMVQNFFCIDKELIALHYNIDTISVRVSLTIKSPKD